MWDWLCRVSLSEVWESILWVIYLHDEIWRVVQQHHESTNSDKVGTVGETDEADGGDVMNHLLLEVLQHTDKWTQSVSRRYSNNIRATTRKSVQDFYVSLRFLQYSFDKPSKSQFFLITQSQKNSNNLVYNSNKICISCCYSLFLYHILFWGKLNFTIKPLCVKSNRATFCLEVEVHTVMMQEIIIQSVIRIKLNLAGGKNNIRIRSELFAFDHLTSESKSSHSMRSEQMLLCVFRFLNSLSAWRPQRRTAAGTRRSSIPRRSTSTGPQTAAVGRERQRAANNEQFSVWILALQ